jgi:hydrogenase nickel incorporation protein HypB
MNAEHSVITENNRIAKTLREIWNASSTLVLNFIGSPGSGKTSLLERTLERLPSNMRASVLTGDIQTDHDRRRLSPYGYPVRQITTGGVCHLDARRVERHVKMLQPEGLELLLIENVGNLVCPASHDLGEDAKVVVLSVPEGEDKPLKYPGIFRKAELMILNKMDLLPHIPFRLEVARENALRVNPRIEIIETSCTAALGLRKWMIWLAARAHGKPSVQPDDGLVLERMDATGALAAPRPTAFVA